MNDKKIEDIERFVKEAFCVEGTVKFVNQKKVYPTYFEVVDKKRGKFTISFHSE
jgi:hypothetical protein